MRVFVVCGDRGIPIDGTKGASIHLRSVVEGLRRCGADVTVFTKRRPKDAGLSEPFDCAGDVVAVAEAEGTPDAIYERYSLGCTDGLTAARVIGCTHVLEVNAPLVDEAVAHRPDTVGPDAAQVEARLLRETDAVVTVSATLARWVGTVRECDDVNVVPNGVDPMLFPRAFRFDPESARIVFLGHPKPWHGAQVLPEICAAARRCGIASDLLVVGGGSGADAVVAAAERAGVGDFVRVTGPIPQADVLEALDGAAVALAPYPRIDPFYFCPIKILEYMAAGLPVVTTRQGDIPELLDEAGVAVPPGDPDALTRAVVELLADPERRREMGQRGRERVIGSFTWDHTVARVLAIVERVTQQREARR